MARKKTPYVYWKGDVTAERVREFADASVDDQRKALAELRKVANNDEAATQLGIVAVLVALIAVILPLPRLAGSHDPIVQTVVAFSVGVLAVVVLLPLVIPVMWASFKRSGAIALLGAYEDELARRHRDRSWSGRAWRRNH